jgi:hypothetical protein
MMWVANVADGHSRASRAESRSGHVGFPRLRSSFVLFCVAAKFRYVPEVANRYGSSAAQPGVESALAAHADPLGGAETFLIGYTGRTPKVSGHNREVRHDRDTALSAQRGRSKGA